MEELFTKDRLDLKVKDLKNYLKFLIGVLPKKLEDYEKDLLIKAVSERYFEKIVEAIIDVGFLIVKLKGLRIPLLDESVFSVLGEYKIIQNELAEKLSNAKSMRNFIVHQYGGIDDEKIFHSINEELIPDVKEFLEVIDGKKGSV